MKVLLGIILGYVVMAGLVMGSFSLAYLAIGSERAFLPQSYQVSPLWVFLSIALGFLAAYCGGWVCRRISRSPRGPLVLAGVVVVLGLVLAFLALDNPPDLTLIRETSLTNREAMEQAQQPPWMAFLNPLIGAVGVLFGGRSRGRS